MLRNNKVWAHTAGKIAAGMRCVLSQPSATPASKERGMGQVTGDLHGAVARLQRELKQLKYPGEADEVG